MTDQPREFSIHVNKMDLALKCWGDDSLPPILALHGWLDNAGSFDLVAPFLKRFQILAVDMPGHGYSSHWPQGMSYHSIDAVGVLAQIIRYFSWENIILLGHSMGASIASLFAGAFPEKVSKLILIEGLGPLAAPADDTPNRLRRSIMQYAELPFKKMPIYPSVEEALEIRRKFSQMSTEAARPIVTRGLKKIEGGYTWRTDPRLKMESPYRMTEEQISSCLKQISCPVLWIRANQGMNLETFMSVERQKTIKNLKTLRLDGNHFVHLESPNEVAKAILDFI